MGIPWETSMGWDRHILLWDGNGTDKYVPWTTLLIRNHLWYPAIVNCENTAIASGERPAKRETTFQDRHQYDEKVSSER